MKNLASCAYDTRKQKASQEVVCIFISEALEIYYYDVPDKPLYSFLEFIGPGVHVDEISKNMCARYVQVMDSLSMQVFHRELSQFLRWAYTAGYTERNLASKIKYGG